MQKLLSWLVQNIKDGDIIKIFNELKKNTNESIEEVEIRQLYKLNKLLNYAYNNVPYYRNLLNKTNLVKNGTVSLQKISELSQIPFLTKEIIRKEKERLYSNDFQNRKSYKNTTGGSTGEPVVFLQDRYFQVNNLANFLLIRSWRGADPYDSTVILWGAERDTFEGKKPIKAKIIDFLLNIETLNTFYMSNKIMKNYIEIINKKKPKIIQGYVQSIYEIAKFSKVNKIPIEEQNAIHAGAGTVYDFMRKEIESAFHCKVYNHYGTREMGVVASECNAHDGLHIMMEHTIVEVVDKNGDQCRLGEEGEIVVTTLNNYSMPLIRYKIGDIGILQKYEKCKCGCSYPKLEKVLGRKTDLFKTTSGSIVMPEYFIHLIGVVYNRGNIKKFQIIQKKLDLVIIKIVIDGEILQDNLDEIENKIKIVMGQDCKVVFECLDNIPKTKTGKFLYTISKV